jgi:hypothetical protein
VCVFRPISWTGAIFCNDNLTGGRAGFSYYSAVTDLNKPVFEFRAAAPAPQNRWGVLLRIFLVVPQLLFAGLVLYAAVFLTFFAWFYMLFTGRNPYHDFNSKALRTYQRFTGYLYFLTSEYPAFSLDEDPNYAMVSRLDQSDLGRAKVFFRIILMIPVLLVTWVLSYGLTLIGLLSWFILLIRGTLPRPIHNAVVAIIRFNGRVGAYVLLLQDPYPRGLFGDKTAPPTYEHSSPLDHSNSDSLLPTHFASDDSTTEGLAGADDVASVPSTLRPYPTVTEPAEGESNSEEAQLWRLALSSGSKVVVIVALIVGVAAAGLYTRFAHFNWTVRDGIESNISVSTWDSRYRSDVVNLRNATIEYQSTFDAKHPKWSDLLSDCQAVQNSYKAFDSVPYYPIQGPDQDLISGLQSIYAGYNDCITIVAPYKVTKAMPLLATQFNQGQEDLKTFLQQT